MKKKNVNGKKTNEKATTSQKVAIHYGENEAVVDARIAPLVLELWKADIEVTAATYLPCDRVSIAFTNEPSLLYFLKILMDHGVADDPLLDHLMGKDQESAWLYILYPKLNIDDDEDMTENAEVASGMIDDEDEMVDDEDIHLFLSFAFAAHFFDSDVPLVLKRIKEHNRLCASQASDSNGIANSQ